MNHKEKFFELFKHDLKTERLELRILEPTTENAALVWNALKNENPDDFKYAPMISEGILPRSQDETLQMLQSQKEWCKNGVGWYVFYNNALIGYQSIIFWYGNRTIKCLEVWFLRKYWGQGFNQEVHNKIEEIAFEKLQVNRICRECAKDNVNSFNSIQKSGFHLDGEDRQAFRMTDGTFLNQYLFSKLLSEYKQQKNNS